MSCPFLENNKSKGKQDEVSEYYLLIQVFELKAANESEFLARLYEVQGELL